MIPNPLRLDPTRTATLARCIQKLVSHQYPNGERVTRCPYPPHSLSFLQEVEGTLKRAYRAGYCRSTFDVRRSQLSVFGINSVADLTNVTDAQRAAIAEILGTAAAKGQNPRKVATVLAKATGLPKDRALLIAQTELISAYAEGQLDALEHAGVEEVTAAVEWVTTGDGKVCPRCKFMEGKVFKIADARGRIPLHPRCRCAWVPAETVSITTFKPKKHPTKSRNQTKKETYNV